MRYEFTASAEIDGTLNEAQRKLDAFRETVLPGPEYGVVLTGLRPQPGTNHFMLDVEIEAESPEDAADVFDNFREAALPGAERDITLWNLTPVPGSVPKPSETRTYGFTASAEIDGTLNQAQGKLDAFRDAVLPGPEYGVVLTRLRPQPGTGHFMLDVEIKADSPEGAAAAFDRFREAALPGTEHGITLWNLTPVRDSEPEPDAPKPR